MMNNKASYQIKTITSRYKEGSFPRSRIPKELSLYLDLVFNKQPDHPKKEHQTEGDKDYFPYLIFDEKYKKVSISHTRGGWKGEENNDFFDNFKGKFSQNEVQMFKRNSESTSTNAVNIVILNNRLLDLTENPGLKSIMKNDSSMTAEDFFSSYNEESFKKGNYTKLSLVECIFRVNERINYPRNKPLWYVYHSEAESSYGPLTSLEIEQMVNSKLLDQESKIRMIDIYVYKGFKQFDFFPLKELQLDNFTENICVSSLAYNFKVCNKNLMRRVDLGDKDEMYGKSK